MPNERITPRELEAAITTILPEELKGRAREIAGLILHDIDVSDNNDLKVRLKDDPEVNKGLKALIGHSVELSDTVISFGKSNQLGNVSIGDVAGGNVSKTNNTINISIISKTRETTPKSEHRKALKEISRTVSAIERHITEIVEDHEILLIHLLRGTSPSVAGLLTNVMRLVEIHNNSRSILPPRIDSLVRGYIDAVANKFPINRSGTYYRIELHFYIDYIQEKRHSLVRKSNTIIKEINKTLRPSWEKWRDYGLTTIYSIVLILFAVAAINNFPVLSERLTSIPQLSFVSGLFAEKPSQVVYMSNQEVRRFFNNELSLSIVGTSSADQRVAVIMGTPREADGEFLRSSQVSVQRVV